MEQPTNQIPPAKLSVERLGSDSFRMLKVQLSPGQMITVEPGAMASQDATIDLTTNMNGGFIQALIAKFFGNESFFINVFANRSASPATVYLTQSTPGDIVECELKNETIFIEPGSFIARNRGIQSSVVWAGFSSFIAGEGLFRLKFQGTGRLWYGSFGAIVEKDVVGDFIVDSGHLLSYPPTIELSLKLPGGWISSFLSKEGFVLKLSGKGKILLQTRSVKGLAQWLNSRFWG
jgi:uncharacterized protein (TIGR00266 family)